MIIWGGGQAALDATNTGGRYNPSTDRWTPTSISGAPSARSGHTAIWTGTEMIVWGGTGEFAPERTNTGCRYNPTTDTWTATNTTAAPSAVSNHTAVWTGAEMIVWGGSGGGIPSGAGMGGRYNPTTNTWIATSTVGAPSVTSNHTALWTGTEMIVWGEGAADGTGFPKSVGARYNPSTDTWEDVIFAFVEIKTTTLTRVAYSAAVWPTSVRSSHSAVWTGNAMILFGGRSGWGASPFSDCEIITPSKSYLYSKP
jgi:N-acetylneuraminic acid mutarotase